VLYQLKRYQEALEASTQAIVLDPNLARAYIRKSNALMRLRRYEEALPVHDRAIELAPFGVHILYYSKGKALLLLKRYAEALAVYGQTIARFPNYAAYLGKARALWHLGQHRQAIAALLHALYA
jgi:tetratricopeptide (TPR) repeat protein